MKEKSSKFLTTFSWIFSVFCLLTLPILGFSIGSLLAFIVGVFALPIKLIQDLWKRLLKGKNWIKPIFLGVLFFLSACVMPTEDVDSTSQGNNVAVVTTTKEPTTDVKQISTEEPTEKPTEKPTLAPTVEPTTPPQPQLSTNNIVTLADIPEYIDAAYTSINDNVPYFTDDELTTASYEFYSDLDSLGRCGVAYACIGQDIMPAEERGSIGQVKPSGWHTVKYDCVDGNYLYNRCHLIGYQLTGENANEQNLITGTRSMNVGGMLPFENMVADYVQETNNHVLYRVTPIYDGDNLVSNGVLMEAKSVEDDGQGILFNVFVYNVQPGVEIDYTTGDSCLEKETNTIQSSAEVETETPKQETAEKATEQPSTVADNQDESTMVWISATGSKYHSKNNCGRMNPKKARQMSEEDAEKQGYEPCKKCY